MGNTAPQRRCREASTAARTEGKRSESAVDVEAPAAPKRAAVMLRDNEEREEEVMTTQAAGRRRAGVSQADSGNGGASAGRVVTMKIMMRRKDAEALVARLHAQNARERKARMAELKRQLRAGDDGRGGASPASCRDAWRPRLASIQENQC